MAPTLQPYTYQFGDTGYTLNTDYGGVLPFFDVDSISGLDGAPPRVTTSDRSMRDGSVVGAGYMGERTIVINGTMYTTSNDPETTLDRLRAEYGPKRLGLPTPYGLPQYSPTAVQPFYFQHPGKPLRMIMAQGGGVQYAIDTNRRLGITASVQLTLLCSDPYIYDVKPVDFLSTGFTVGPLNQNSNFDSGVAPWTPVNNAAIAQSSVLAFSGYYSLRLNGNGSTANPIARSEQTINVVVKGKYTASVMVYSPSAWASGCQVNVRWYNSSGTFLSASTGTSSSLSAGTWKQYTISATAPTNAAFASIDLSVLGTPTAGQFFYFDQAQIVAAGGAAFPFDFNVNFGGAIGTNPAVAVSNTGTHTAYPFLTIFGPITNPTITDALYSQTMPFGIQLATTDILLIDTRNRMIILQSGTPIPFPPKSTTPTPPADVLTGTNFQDPYTPFVAPAMKYLVRNARGALQGSTFFNLPAGSSDTYTLTGSGTSVLTKFRVTTYNTYY